jgi:hypothetical protein
MIPIKSADRTMQDLEAMAAKAVHLRWALRDIKGNRTKLSPVNPDDLRTLIEMGLVEMRVDSPTITAKVSPNTAIISSMGQCDYPAQIIE